MPDAQPSPGETSIELLLRAQKGDSGALDALCGRYLPRLKRWATGRLPMGTRSLLETDDLVQETMLRSLHRIEDFEIRREGALLAYLRAGILNRIRDEARRLGRRPGTSALHDEIADRAPSPLEQAVGRDGIERYERALEQLSDIERQGVIARLELGCDFREIAEATGRASANAARMMVTRAILKMAEEMGDG